MQLFQWLKLHFHRHVLRGSGYRFSIVYGARLQRDWTTIPARFEPDLSLDDLGIVIGRLCVHGCRHHLAIFFSHGGNNYSHKIKVCMLLLFSIFFEKGSFCVILIKLQQKMSIFEKHNIKILIFLSPELMPSSCPPPPPGLSNSVLILRFILLHTHQLSVRYLP